MTERYQNGKIYKLVSDVSDDVYYGSTCLPLAKRFWKHKDGYNQFTKRRKGNYVSSFPILARGFNTVDIVLVEEYPCDNKMQLLRRERYYIENNDCVNKQVPTRTQKEYRADNRNRINARKREHYLENKERINLSKKIVVNCPCGSNVKKGDIAKHMKTKKHKDFELELRRLKLVAETLFKNIITISGRVRELLPKLKI